MWTTAGEDLTLNFPFMHDGQFVIPDPGSVRVTIRDNDGVTIQDWSRVVQPDPVSTTFSLVVPAAVNDLSSGNALESRYVRLEYAYEGKAYGKNVSYRLTPFLPIQATPAGVRNRLGATETEMPDETIDIHEAYYKLLPGYPEILPAALKAKDGSCISANNAIEIKAALELMPGISSKILQSETQDNGTYARMKVNFERLQALLENQLIEELRMMVEVSSGLITAVGGGTLMVLTNPPNVITGASS
jgi:hypothetical protein